MLGRPTAGPAVWTADGDWSASGVPLSRPCWDYHGRVDDFRDWLEAVEGLADGVEAAL